MYLLTRDNINTHTDNNHNMARLFHVISIGHVVLFSARRLLRNNTLQNAKFSIYIYILRILLINIILVCTQPLRGKMPSLSLAHCLVNIVMVWAQLTTSKKCHRYTYDLSLANHLRGNYHSIRLACHLVNSYGKSSLTFQYTIPWSNSSQSFS